MTDLATITARLSELEAAPDYSSYLAAWCKVEQALNSYPSTGIAEDREPLWKAFSRISRERAAYHKAREYDTIRTYSLAEICAINEAKAADFNATALAGQMALLTSAIMQTSKRASIVQAAE